MSEITVERIREYLGKKGIGGMFVSHPVNVKYVSGYTGDDSYLFLTEDKKYFITDPRYTEQVSLECPDYTIVEWRAEYGSIPGAAAGLAKKENVKTMGFEQDHLVVSFYQELQEKFNGELVGVSGIVEELRTHKTPQEITYLKAACEIASRAFERIIKDIRPGITVKELAANLSRYMVLEGGGYTALWKYSDFRGKNFSAPWNSILKSTGIRGSGIDGLWLSVSRLYV